MEVTFTVKLTFESDVDPDEKATYLEELLFSDDELEAMRVTVEPKE